MEVCWKKSLLAGVGGIGMGISLASFMGTFEGAHGEIIGDGTMQQVKNGFKRTWAITWWRTKHLAPNFAMVGVVWSGLECSLEKRRGVHDLWNPVAAGSVAGALFNGIPRAIAGQRGLSLVRSTVMGALGFAAFGFAIEWVMHTDHTRDFMDRQREKALRNENK
jgi:import inner membrane translocase subunit TIM22